MKLTWTHDKGVRILSRDGERVGHIQHVASNRWECTRIGSDRTQLGTSLREAKVLLIDSLK